LQVLEVQPLDPAGEFCAYLFDAWENELGIGKDRKWFLLAMDGMPIYTLRAHGVARQIASLSLHSSGSFPTARRNQ
jgi:hypothetical protein